MSEVKVNMRFRDENGNIIKAYPVKTNDKFLQEFATVMAIFGTLVSLIIQYLHIPFQFFQ